MSKIIFLIKIDSIVDTITNSSSELFVGINASKEELQAAIEAIYPAYRTEYDRLRYIDELDLESLNIYFEYATSPSHWPASKEEYPILPGFTFEELYEPRKDSHGNIEIAWNDEIQYRLKNNNKKLINEWDSAFVTEENRVEIINKLDPGREMHFMFSLDDNPDWEMQEKLSEFMMRYHLG